MVSRAAGPKVERRPNSGRGTSVPSREQMRTTPRSPAPTSLPSSRRVCFVPEGKYVGQKLQLQAWQKDRDLPHLRQPTRHPAGNHLACRGRTPRQPFRLPATRPSLWSARAQQAQQSAVLGGAEPRSGGHHLLARGQDGAAEPRIGAGGHYPGNRQGIALPRARNAATARSPPTPPTAYGLSPGADYPRRAWSGPWAALATLRGVGDRDRAQASPLSIIISTQAPTDADLLSILIDDALAGHDPHTVVSLYTASTGSGSIRGSDDPAREPRLRAFMNHAKCSPWLQTPGGCQRVRPSTEIWS